MRYLRIVITGLIVSLLIFNLIGCSENEEKSAVETTGGVYIVNGKAETLSVLDVNTAEMKNDVLNLGKWPADIKVAGDKVYVVNTGDNNVQIIDLTTLQQVGLINIGENTGPERIAFGDDNKAYVSCLYTNSVKVVDTASQKVTKDVPVGVGPMGVAVAGKKAYVCNPAYDFVSNSYGKGTVSVIDLSSETVTKTVDVGTNPLEAITAGSKVVVLCVGNYVDVMGQLCIIDSASDAVEKTIDLNATPSGIAVSPKNVAYMTTFGGLISVDIASGALTHDAGSPLQDFAGGSGIAFSKDGNAYICVADWEGGGNDKVLVMDASEKLVATYKAGGGASIVAVRD
jgi:YVTN family beta-propeller protein